MDTQRPLLRSKWLAVLFCWLLFGGGLLVHFLAPNLERTKDAFVVPLELARGTSALNPAQIVSKERRMQVLSALMTTVGALGLGYFYLGKLFRNPSRGAMPPTDVTKEAPWVSDVPRTH